MNKPRFKPVMLLALLFPLLGAGLGFLLSNTGTQSTATVEATLPAIKPGEAVAIPTPADPLPQKKAEGPGNLELGLYLALVCGTAALLWQYLKSQLAWVAVILLALVFAFLLHNQIELSLTQFFLANLLLGVALALLVKFLFFLKALIRWRMIVTSLLGAGLILLYSWSLFGLAGRMFDTSQWSKVYVDKLLLFVFITFGLSLADLVIQRAEISKLRANRAEAGDEDA